MPEDFADGEAEPGARPDSPSEPAPVDPTVSPAAEGTDLPGETFADPTTSEQAPSEQAPSEQAPPEQAPLDQTPAQGVPSPAVAASPSWVVSPEGSVEPTEQTPVAVAPTGEMEASPWPPTTAPQPIVSAPWPPTAAALPYPGGSSVPPPGSSTSSTRTDNGRPGRARGWILVAVIAALIGAGVGAGVTAATDNGNGSGVTVNEASTAPGAATLSGNVSIPQLVHKVLPAVVSIDVKSSTTEDEGTGMIISSSGEIITNNHVVALAEAGAKMTVTESGTTKKQTATLIGADPANDMALLQIKGASGLPTVTLGNSNKLQVGDAVVAIGNALGLQAGTPTVTQGIVSALGRTVTAGDSGSSTTETLTNMIQTDAAINPGNSGGPLIDTRGQVIGMNTAVAGSTSGGTSAQNIGFAIPAAKIESLLPELQKGGTLTTGGGVLGVDVTTLTTQLRQQYGFTPTAGAVVLSVVPGSPAAKAKLRQGDVIVAVGSTKVTSAETLQKAISKHKAGDSVQLTYYVGDLKQTASVTLESQAAEQQQAQASGGAQSTSGTTGTTSTSTSKSTSSTPSPFGGL